MGVAKSAPAFSGYVFRQWSHYGSFGRGRLEWVMAEAKHLRTALERPTIDDRGCRWYVANQGRTSGPYSYEELLDLARTGSLTSAHHVWRAGFVQWISVAVRPDLIALVPARPRLGLVPSSLEAADALKTEDLRWSRDVVHEAADTEMTVDLPRLPPLPVAEEAALSSEEEDWEVPFEEAALIPPIEAIAAGLAAEADLTRAADLLVGDLDLAAAGLSRPPPASLEASGEGAAFARSLRRSRLTRMGLVLALVGLMSGLFLLIWQVEKDHGSRLFPGTTPSHTEPVFERRVPDQLRVERVIVEQAVLQNKRMLLPQPVDKPARERSVKETPTKDTPAKDAPASEPPTQDLSWLNQAPQASEREPEARQQEATERGVPRQYRIRTEVPAALPEAPLALSVGLSDEQVGQVVSASLPSLARCARFDRLSQRLPPGSRIRVTVEGEGRVRTARASGAVSEVSSCLQRAARTLTFPRFSGSAEQVEIHFSRGGTVRTRVLP